ncbi:acetyl-CoA acetyltransferase family protein [Evansella vedderi]|uniref:Acetyl-CoA acetyltransferase family protein n=1 Tax=Evansella vedderi TaxID=38282 RepID=A0ABU0A1D0_9BACI|nr:thiolase family protein [Evansella vedderi]MDQ0256929.1 acetyl-CoA acetyltransferase family protein [Evansella vedderi]
MRETVIIGGVRTPIGRRNGKLSHVRPDELLAKTLAGLMEKTKVDPKVVEDVIAGCVSQVGEQAPDIARTAALIAGFPIHVPGVTIDRQCGSSQQAVHFASQAIASGDMDVVIACGVESMSRVPMFSNMQDATYSPVLTEKYELINQGLSAERIAEIWEMSREELDTFALESHQKALKAREAGIFKKEILSIKVRAEGINEWVNDDEGPRENTSIEKLGQLKTVFQKDGVITAGNSSQISDGAAAILLMSREKAEELGLKPRFRIVARSVVGSDPTLMLTGPIPATKKVLEKAGLTLDDMNLYEVNEAFASVPLVWQKELNADPAKLNIHGGAISLGHPLGASGARVMVTLMNALEQTGGRYGLQAICEGFGMANATIIERLDE